MDSVHHYGRVWNLSMMVLLLMFPAAVSIIFHAPADGKGLLMGLIATAPMYWAVGFIETSISSLGKTILNGSFMLSTSVIIQQLLSLLK